jgi:hypothetical protein
VLLRRLLRQRPLCLSYIRLTQAAIILFIVFSLTFFPQFVLPILEYPGAMTCIVRSSRCARDPTLSLGLHRATDHARVCHIAGDELELQHTVQTLGWSALCTAFSRVLQSLIVGLSDLCFNPQYPKFAPHILEPVQCHCIPFKELT